jgi:uncharacterized RDD family membrane protein YckC
MTRYSTFGARVLAGIVDGLVLIPLALADAWLAGPGQPPPVILAWGIVTYNAYWLYSVLLHARKGKTLGKMALGITVLDVSEARIPTLRQAFLREAPYIALNWASLLYLFTLVLTGRYVPDAELTGRPAELLSLAGGAWFLLEIVTTLTNGKRRAIHDFIASTVVVRDVVAEFTVLPPGLPLACPRCAARQPSRYYFAKPDRRESVCLDCARTEPAAPPA